MTQYGSCAAEAVMVFVHGKESVTQMRQNQFPEKSSMIPRSQRVIVEKEWIRYRYDPPLTFVNHCDDPPRLV